MKTISIIANASKVIEKFRHFLTGNKFINIDVNYSSGEITAEKKNLFFKKGYKVKLTVREVRDNVTNVQLTVNPQHPVPNSADREWEREWEKLFFHIHHLSY